MKITIPNDAYKKTVRDILYADDIAIDRGAYDFNTIRRKIFASEKLTNAMNANGVSVFYEISSGTSDLPTWDGFLDQTERDVRNPDFYREYTTAKGNLLARRTLAYMESCKLTEANTYTADDFCITDGSTGAITSVLEYMKKAYPTGEVLIASPNYYLYSFAASYFTMNVREIIPTLGTSDTCRRTIDALLARINKNTKLIILTNPTNPTGQVYAATDLKKLLVRAKKENIIVLVDELFAELVFEGKRFVYADEIAERINSMQNLVIIKGFSKTKNLPGLRIGYAFSKNKILMDGISLVSQIRQCFPVGSAFTGLISLNACLGSIRFIKNRFPKRELRTIISYVTRTFPSSTSPDTSSIRSLTRTYRNYLSYGKRLMRAYDDLYNLTLRELRNDSEWITPKESAFNTFVKIRGLNNINYFDFMVNLYVTTGVKIEFGPCFGLTQKQWEADSNLGFCIRITYTKDKKMLRTGIRKFLEFTKLYMKYPDKLISTGLYFPNLNYEK